MSLAQDEQMVSSRATIENLKVRCMVCGTVATADVPISVCPTCGGLLDCLIPDLDQLTRSTLANGASVRLRQSGVWKYRAILPAIPDDAVVTRFEGNTPLYIDDRIADYAGIASFGLKHEGQNPTASFKDRGMTVGVSHAKAVGAKIVACASTGNTSASLASYAAAARMAALVLIPEGKISAGKLSQTIAHGARVVQIQGDFDQALTLLRELTAKYPVYLVNSVNPFRLECDRAAGGQSRQHRRVRQGAARSERSEIDRQNPPRCHYSSCRRLALRPVLRSRIYRLAVGRGGHRRDCHQDR
jgi:threonine synthase